MVSDWPAAWVSGKKLNIIFMWGKNLNGIEMIGWKATLEVVKQKNHESG